MDNDFNDNLYDEIISDASHISQFVTRTPIVRLPWLDAPNRKVWAKLENKQLTNSFKVRGAYNAARKIDENKTLVTASAGNHGLAVAFIADHLGRKSRIFVPANASEAKLKRLINMGADVVPAGRDLFEATEIARANADGEFISPFSHPDVIRGQGSLAVEILSQYSNQYDNLLVPLGGGGLIAGVSTVFKKNSPKTKIVGVHPEVFQRDLRTDFTDGLSKPVYPTIADGLAVQHSSLDSTAHLVTRLTDRVDHISESDIELAVAAMLYNEGLLIEGAGAIGVAALINDPEGNHYKGDTLLLVCGGNISTPTLMQALASHTDNERLARLTGYRSIQLPSEAVQYKKVKSLTTAANSNFSERAGRENVWMNLVGAVEDDIEKFKDDLNRHNEFTKSTGLENPGEIMSYIDAQAVHTDQLIKYCRNGAKTDQDLRLGFRLLIQNYAYLRNSLAWCSASSDQSRRVMFFDPAENTSSAVNYDRYGSVLLRERELGLLKALGHDQERVDLLLTSSGQAAYGVIESFLLREKLSKSPKVVTSPYIYFEAMEQIQSLKNVDFYPSETWDIPSIVKSVEDRDADVLFIDPMANLGSLHTTNFRDLAKEIGDRDWSNKWLVVDGTMTSGGVNVFNIFDKKNHPQVLYYESGSKYLQLGMDLQMAGVVIADKEHSPALARHRRNTGGVMYQNGVLKFPRYDRDTFLSRMSTITENAEIFHDTLSAFDPTQEKMEVSYPKNWRDMGWAHGGGIVSVMMKDPGLNNRSCLDYLIDLIIAKSRKEDIPITKGVSFGFSTTRVSAAAAMANDMPPFLRFSIGEDRPEEIAHLGRVVVQSLDQFFKTYRPGNDAQENDKRHLLAHQNLNM